MLNVTAIAGCGARSAASIFSGETLEGSDPWGLIAYGNGRYVICTYEDSYAQDRDKIRYSDDGKTWASVTLPVSGKWKGLAYGNGLFVLVTNDTNPYLTSPDGINWTQRTTFPVGQRTRLVFRNGLFIAIGYSNSLAYSSDGINWTTVNTGLAAGCDIDYGNGIWVLMAANSISGTTTYKTSPNLAAWTSRTIPFTSYYAGVAFGNGKFVLISGGGYSSSRYESTDGINWTAVQNGTGYIGPRIVHGDGKFVVVGKLSNDSASTSIPVVLGHGIKMETWPAKTSRYIDAVYDTDKKEFMAVGRGGSAIARAFL